MGRTEYIAWRTTVFERDAYTCQMCGERGGMLNAHHIKPWKDYPTLRHDIANGITLCLHCHKAVKHNGVPLTFKQQSLL